jgi:hypothetical protein
MSKRPPCASWSASKLASGWSPIGKFPEKRVSIAGKSRTRHQAPANHLTSNAIEIALTLVLHQPLLILDSERSQF